MGLFILFALLVKPLDSPKEQKKEVISSTQSTDNWFGRDKFHHFSYSFGLTGLSYHLYHCQLNNPNPEAKYFSISLTTLTGIGKEFYDKIHKKTDFSYKDLIWDAIGITAATFVFLR